MPGETNQTQATPSAATGKQSEGGLAADAKAVEVAAVDPGAAIERAVENWLQDHIRNSPLSRATPAWNHLQSKIGELVAYIKKEL